MLCRLNDDNIRTIERNSDALINAFKDNGLGVNVQKTNYMESELSGLGGKR